MDIVDRLDDLRPGIGCLLDEAILDAMEAIIRLRAALAAEREACAKIADRHAAMMNPNGAAHTAIEIRARIGET